jgi:hypothetical protein
MKSASFKKTLLLCPQKYSLKNVFRDIISEFSDVVVDLDIRNYVSKNEVRINTQIFRFPDSVRRKWIKYYQQKINENLLRDFRFHNLDLVFVYNNEMLLPATIKEIQKTAKVVFYLGDSPFYTHTNHYFLALLNLADMVLVPDTF